MRIKALIGFAAALMFFTTACSSAASPSTAVPSAAATSTSATAVLSNTPAPAGATPAAGTPAPAKTEEKEKTPASGEEPAEGPPKPNPLPTIGPGGNANFAPVPGADITKAGAAATIHGSAAAGQAVFTQNCAVCHGPDGKGGVPNPGSDDGTVPPLNPIDPGFKASATGDSATFAGELDLFIQHGSRPSGSNPSFSMIPWGDQNKLTQQQLADVEAYVIQLNGG